MSLATLRARLGVTAATVLIIGFGLAATPAFASTTAPTKTLTIGSASNTSSGHHHESRAAKRHAAKVRRHNTSVQKVLREAQRQKGKPYVYGDDGPHGFDCSGLVRFVFMHSVHRVLPHNAAAQYHTSRHIGRRSVQRGDLVFVDNGGYISHVGIYDGHGYWWVAPHTGTHVQRQKIYHAHLLYARVLVYDKHLKAHHHKK
jgi:cell wall-associated NlpC family hydrolase